MARVVIYEQPNHPRSRHVCAALEVGIRRCGDAVRRIPSTKFGGAVEEDVAVFYGLGYRCGDIMRVCMASGHTKAVYVDLGYWGRREGGRFRGYHKIVVNARHPTEYFQREKHSGSRLAKFNIRMKPWRERGRHILIAGMGPKAASAARMAPCQWEAQIIKALASVTKRPIVYRPKPNWREAFVLPGASFTPPGSISLETQLEHCHAIISHHSNANLDALASGVPSFTWGGVAQPLSLSDLSRIEDPLLEGDREQLFRDIAWVQWNLQEMEQGLPWRHLKSEGLIP